jgi:hypothetical protein
LSTFPFVSYTVAVSWPDWPTLSDHEVCDRLIEPTQAEAPPIVSVFAVES